jgi:transcription antitermination factor NusA-like protein
MDKSLSEQIKATKLLIADTEARIAAIREEIEQDKIKLVEQQRNLEKHLANLQRLGIQKLFTD